MTQTPATKTPVPYLTSPSPCPQHETFHASKFFGTVECNTPTTKLYRFHGSVIHQRSQQRVPINSDNLMLREGVLKNTDYVEGIVVYAGAWGRGRRGGE